MGFAQDGSPVHQTVAASAQSVAKSKSWAQVVHSSRSVMTFIDLAGHEKYLKTTIAGLTGSHPDYALAIVAIAAEESEEKSPICPTSTQSTSTAHPASCAPARVDVGWIMRRVKNKRVIV